MGACGTFLSIKVLEGCDALVQCSNVLIRIVAIRFVAFNSVDGGGFETFETTGIPTVANRYAYYFFVMHAGFLATATNC